MHILRPNIRSHSTTIQPIQIRWYDINKKGILMLPRLKKIFFKRFFKNFQSLQILKNFRNIKG